jgi:hypothetical protein
MTTDEPKRNLFQTAVYNFFALYLGVTPPAPGQELFYAGLLLGIALLLIVGSFFAIRLLMSRMLG